MSDELNQVKHVGAYVPQKIKGMPTLVDKGKASPSGKDKAVALLEEAFRDKRITKHALIRQANESTAAVFNAFQHFEDALGGRSKLIEVLQHCPENSNGYVLVRKLLADPDFVSIAVETQDEDAIRYTLANVCLRQKIPLSAIVHAFKDAKTAQIAIETLTQVAEHAPTVVNQIIEDAQNRFETCIVCEGVGRIWSIAENGEWNMTDAGAHVTQLCHGCRGKGKTFKEHDSQSRQQFLKLTGLIEDRKTPLVSITQQAAVFKKDFVPGDGSFEDLLKAVEAVTRKPKQEEEAFIDVPFTVYEQGEEEKVPPDPTPQPD